MEDITLCIRTWHRKSEISLDTGVRRTS